MRLVAVIIMALAGGLQAAEPTTQSAESKLVAELFGKRIAEAVASPDSAKNMSLAHELMTAAEDKANPAGLRAMLAVEAAKVATPVGSKEATDLICKALALSNSLNPQPSMERSQTVVNVLRQQLAAAKQKSPTDVPGLAGNLARAELALALAQAADEKVEAATTTLTAAKADAHTSGDSDLEDEVTNALKDIKVLALRANRVKSTEEQLQKAQADNDAAGVKAARQKLGLIYLLVDGDIAKAATHLAGTDSPCEQAVTALALFQQDSKRLPPADKAGDIVDQLLKTANSAELTKAKIKIASATAALGKAFVTANPGGLVATKVRLLSAQAEDLAGESPAAKLMAKVKENYKGLGAKMESVHDDVFKFTYDFSFKKQGNDWCPRYEDENWDININSGCLTASPKNFQFLRTQNRLRFKADKPLKLSFKATAGSDITAILTFEDFFKRDTMFQYGADNNRTSVLRDSGDRLWFDDKVRIGRGEQRVEITWDGEKTFTWAINSAVQCKVDRKIKMDLTRQSLWVSLETAGYAATFDNVVIEGAILEEPNARLDKVNGGVMIMPGGGGVGTVRVPGPKPTPASTPADE